MIPRKRTPLSATQRAEVWRRWKAGESLHAIGRAVGKDHVVVHLLLKRHGGIAPTSHRRSRRVLTLAEREDISRGIASGCSLRTIAQQVRRAPSTVSREVARHGGRAPLLPDFSAAVAHFHEVLADVARHLELGTEFRGVTAEILLQGPFSDAMTHAGQLAMLRRLAGSPVPPENFVFAAISSANLGSDQPLPVSPDEVWPEKP